MLHNRLVVATVDTLSTTSDLGIKLLSGAFFAGLLFMNLSLITRSEDYARPTEYFLLASVLCAVLAVEMFMASKNFDVVLCLFQTIALNVSLSWAYMAIFPEMTGIDTWWVKELTEAIVRQGFVPAGYSYSSFPLMHILIGEVSILSTLQFPLVSAVATGLPYELVLLLVFWITRDLYNLRTGLIAALLLSVSEIFVQSAMWQRPATLAGLYVLLVIWILHKGGGVKQSKWPVLTVLFASVTVLTHTITSVILVVILFVLWVTRGRSASTNTRTEKASVSIRVPASLWIFCTVATLGWWMYVSTTLNALPELIRSGFDIQRWTVSVLRQGYSGGTLETILNGFGFNFLYFLIVLGIFISFSRQLLIGRRRQFALTGVVLLSSTFGGFILGYSGVAPFRWLTVSTPILCIFAGLGLTGASGIPRGKHITRSIFAAGLIVVLAFSSITSPTVNIDRSFYSQNTLVRFGFTSSELVAAGFLRGHTNSTGTDTYYAWYFDGYTTIFGSKSDITPQILSGNPTSPIVILRHVVIEGPFWVGTRVTLGSQLMKRLEPYNLVYNSYVVEGYARPVPFLLNATYASG